MLKKITAAAAVLFAFVALSVIPVSADDMTQTLFGMNPISTWINQNSRDTRISDGTYRWEEFGSNVADAGHYASCKATPVTGLFVTLTTVNSTTNCSVFNLLGESPSSLGGFPSGTGTVLAADPTQIEIQAILPANTSSASILMTAGASSGQSVSNLFECEAVPGQLSTDTTSQSINIVSSTGIITATTGNRDRVDRPTCQDKPSSSATSPTTPTVDSGFVAIAAVLVPFGTTTVTTGMITAQTAQQFFGFAPLTAFGATAIDTSSTAQTKSGALTLASGVVLGTGGTTLTGSQVGIENDGAGVNGMVLNIPTSSTNGWQFTVNGTSVANINASGGIALKSGSNPSVNAFGSSALFLNFTSGTGGVVFANGASGFNAQVSAAGVYQGAAAQVGTTAFNTPIDANFVSVGTPGTATSGGLMVANASTISGASTFKYTIVDSSTSNTVNTIVGSALEVVDRGNAALMTLDTSGNLGLLGVLHATSSIKKKRDIHIFDPQYALKMARTFPVIRYCLKLDSPQMCGPSGEYAYHLSYAGEWTPWQLSGRHHNNVDPVTLAGFALAVGKGVDREVQHNEKSHDSEVAALWVQIRLLYGFVAVLALAMLYIGITSSKRRC